MAKIRVLLVEDHTVVRQGLRRVLDNDPEIEIVGEVGDGRAAVDAVRELDPTVAVVDISLPNLNGIEVTRQLANASPDTKVLILSMHADDVYVRQSLKAGAKGYLLKDADDHDLIKAVMALSAGGSFFSPAVSKILLEGYLQEGPDSTDELSVLSDREREVLQLIAEGKSTKEIAFALGLSIKTVETHRAAIMGRLDIHDVPGLALFAVRHGLIQLDRGRG